MFWNGDVARMQDYQRNIVLVTGNSGTAFALMKARIVNQNNTPFAPDEIEIGNPYMLSCKLHTSTKVMAWIKSQTVNAAILNKVGINFVQKNY